MNSKHTILNEKWRPDTLEGYICEEQNKLKFEEYIKKQDIPHLLFHGKAGSGKTTLAKILAKNINCDYLYLNATDERSMDVMRDKVGAFASAASFKPLKIIILDEATHILQASQVLLLNMMETYSLKTRFILTGNYVERLIEPLRSRCTEFELIPPTKKEVAKHVSNILDKEEVEHDIKDLAFIINKCYPDLRKIINTCQKFISNNKLVIDEKTVLSDNDYFNKIILELKKPSYKSFNNIRQILADSGVNEFESAYKQLYNFINEYSNGNDGIITIIIEEYRFHSVSRIDQEICICACISRILEILLPKKIIKG